MAAPASSSSSPSLSSSEDKSIQQLYPFIWISDYDGPPANAKHLVSKHNIHLVVNVCDCDARKEQKALYKKHGVKYMYFKTLELSNVDIIKRGMQVARRVRAHQRKGHATLIHCWAGMNRSVCCVLIARMLDEDAPDKLEAALWHIRSIRPIARPMVCFLQKLDVLQREIDEHHKAHGTRLTLDTCRAEKNEEEKEKLD